MYQKEKYLASIREQIDELDNILVDVIAKRCALAKKIGFIKANNKIPIRDIKREQSILKKYSEKAKGYNLCQNFIKELFSLLFEYTVSLQEEILDSQAEKRTSKLKRK